MSKQLREFVRWFNVILVQNTIPKKQAGFI